MTIITKEEILKFVNQGPCRAYLNDLEFTFGFTRMDGKEIALRQLISSRSEEELQMCSPLQLHKNIQGWCSEHGIYCEYNITENSYYFQIKL